MEWEWVTVTQQRQSLVFVWITNIVVADIIHNTIFHPFPIEIHYQMSICLSET